MEEKQVLYIEDELKDPMNTDPFFSELENNNFKVDVAETGEEAVKKLKESRYDCIILDIMLPHDDHDGGIPPGIPRYKTGIYLFEEIKKGSFSENKYTPVVVVSAISDFAEVSKIKRDSWTKAYLDKPIRPPELVNAVKKSLG